MATSEAPASLDLDAFRQEVRDWILANSEGVGGPVDCADLTEEQFWRNRDFLARLGARGWYAPSWPREFGGGGLPLEAGHVIREELVELIPHLENVHPPGDIGGSAAASIWTLGNDEQKRTLLPRLLRGELVVWELYTEPDAGSDLPSLKTTARRDGDDYVFNGTKTWVGGHHACDLMFVMGITDPEGPRQKNLSVFLVPSDTPGIQVLSLDMIAGSRKRTIMLEDARAAATTLVGREGDGWASFTNQMAGYGLGWVGIGPMLDRDVWVLDRLVDYCRKSTRRGAPMSSDPRIKSLLTRLWMEGERERLLRGQTSGFLAGQSGRVSAAQTSHSRKLFDLRLGMAIQEILGPVASIADPEFAPLEGEFEYFQRHAILHAHPGGTVEIQKIRIFHAMEAARPDLVGIVGIATAPEGEMAVADPAEQLSLLRSSMRQFVGEECSLPQRIGYERSGEFGSLWSKLRLAGWAGTLIPERLGGGGAGLTEAGAVWEELGAGLVPGPHLVSSVLAPCLLSHPLAGDQEERLRKLALGERTYAFACAEEEGSSTLDSVALRARPMEDGLRLTGEKWFVADADVADELLCVARSAHDGGLSLFALPREMAGIVIRPMRGWNASTLFQVQFNDVAIEGGNVIGPLGEAEPMLRAAMDAATAVLCAYMVGMAERVTEIAMRYAHQRTQYGQQIARFQHVQSHLVNMRNWTDESRLCTARVLAALDGRRDDPQLSVSLAKATTSRALIDVCEAAHHVHGGIGADKAYGLYLYTKAARTYYHFLGLPAEHEELLARLLAF